MPFQEILNTRRKAPGSLKSARVIPDADHPTFHFLGHARRRVYHPRTNHEIDKRRCTVAEKPVGISPLTEANRSESDSTETPTPCSGAQETRLRTWGEITGGLAGFATHASFCKCQAYHQRILFHVTVVLYLANPNKPWNLERRENQSINVQSSASRWLKSVHIAPGAAR